MYNPEYTASFYNAYAGLEWSRLEATAYGRLQAVIHNDFLKRYIKNGARVLDAGSGLGRFSITVAQLGAKVTVLDISNQQVKLAEQKIAEANLLGQVDRFIRADIVNLSMFPDGCFDSVVCFGGALSYVLEKREEAAKELKRVTRSGGTILVSVMSRLGTMLNIARQPHIPILKQPDESTPSGPGLWQVFGNGDLTGVPSRRTGMMHAPMHLYTTDELQCLFADCQVLAIAGSNVVAPEFSLALDEIAKDSQAWSTLVELERKLNSRPGLVDSGTHIILAVRR
jgi:SAM-dependent methyltransferase